MKKIISLTLAILMSLGMLAFAGCTNNSDDGKNNESETEFNSETDNPVATIIVEDFGKITVELYYDKAPNTVKNFIFLANKGFYDGLTFHRVYSGFMIQGGCPEGDGTGDPGYSIPGEFLFNNFENDLKHERGVISMARSQDPDSAGSQFFIMHQDSTNLDGSYAAFGKVINGMDVVDEIAAVEVKYNPSSRETTTPVEDVVIESITVDTNGKTYDEPQTIVE